MNQESRWQRIPINQDLLKIAGVVFLYTVSCFSFLAIKFAVESIPPLLMTAFRLILAGGILLVIQFFFYKVKISVAELTDVALTSLFFRALSYGLLALSLQSVSSATAGVLSGVYPILVALWQMKVTKQFNSTTFLGTLIGSLGLGLLLFNNYEVFKYEYLLVLASALSYTIGTFLVAKRILPQHLCYEMLLGGLMVLCISPFFESWSTVNIENISTKSMTSFVFLVLFATIFADLVFAWLLRNGAATIASGFGFVRPVFIVFLGWYLGNEILSFNIVVSTILLSVALLLILKGVIMKARKVNVTSTVQNPSLPRRVS